MDRSYSSGAVATPPAAPASPSVGYPTAGSPAAGMAPTKPGPYWYHMVTEELMAVILAAGIAPAQGSLTQLASAIQSGRLFLSAAGGTADAVTGSFTPTITALTNGMMLHVRATSANTATAPTFTPNTGTIAAKTIVKGNGLALVAGDIAGNGHWVELQYDLTLDKWVLLNPASGVNSLGFGQTWQDVRAGRVAGTMYYNTTVRPILVSVVGNVTGGSASVAATVSGVLVSNFALAFGQTGTVSFIVPVGASYSVVVSTGSISAWSELR